MANMETFAKGLMASEDIKSYIGSTKFQKDGVFAEIHDGALVTLGDLAPNAAYDIGGVSGSLDDNTFLSTAPAATTDDVVIVDLAHVSNGLIGGNNYKIGIKQVGLKMEAGFPSRYRVISKGDRFWLSGDCFIGTPAKGKYAIPTAGSTKHTVADSAPTTTGYCVKIIDTREFTVGNTSEGSLYFCYALSNGDGFPESDGLYRLPEGGIPSTDFATAVKTSLGLADTATQPADIADLYTLPEGGIPKTDLAAAVQASLELADNSEQKA